MHGYVNHSDHICILRLILLPWSIAALENLELEVKDMQDMFHQQDSELKVHRDYTLAQVQQAKLVNHVSYGTLLWPLGL